MTQDLTDWHRIDPQNPAAQVSGHGVVALLDGAAQCVTMAATGDILSFCTRRAEDLDSAGPDAHFRARSFGSMFEAELGFVRAARVLMPTRFESLIRAWHPWVLQIDSTKGTWTTQRPNRFHQRSDHSHIGPLASRASATLIGEVLDDVFDLCRYPRELAHAPNGTPCAYKEMGRCPSPCDGTEPWETFSARFSHAVQALQNIDTLTAAIEHQMHACAERSDFERASTLRDRSVKLANDPRVADLGNLPSFVRVALVPNTAQRGIRVFLCRVNGVQDLGFIPQSNSKTTTEHLASHLPTDIDIRDLKSVEPGPYAEFAFVAHRMNLARRPEQFLSIRQATCPDTLYHACRSIGDTTRSQKIDNESTEER